MYQIKKSKKILKASHILIKVKSKSSDKEGLSDKKRKKKLKNSKEVEKNPNKFGEIAKKNQWTVLQLRKMVH